MLYSIFIEKFNERIGLWEEIVEIQNYTIEEKEVNYKLLWFKWKKKYYRYVFKSDSETREEVLKEVLKIFDNSNKVVMKQRYHCIYPENNEFLGYLPGKIIWENGFWKN